jgi:hypothetical protein
MMKGNRNGETILEIMMGYVAPIVGGIITTVTLDQITSLPRWACFAIGLPLGTILGWIACLGIAIMISVVVQKFRR